MEQTLNLYFRNYNRADYCLYHDSRSSFGLCLRVFKVYIALCPPLSFSLSGLSKIPESEEVYTERRPSGEQAGELDEEESSVATIPVITSEQYNQYVRSLIKLLVGEKMLLKWLKKGKQNEG